jgi:hypothetical protein
MIGLRTVAVAAGRRGAPCPLAGHTGVRLRRTQLAALCAHAVIADLKPQYNIYITSHRIASSIIAYCNTLAPRLWFLGPGSQLATVQFPARSLPSCPLRVTSSCPGWALLGLGPAEKNKLVAGIRRAVDVRKFFSLPRGPARSSHTRVLFGQCRGPWG